jgi:hypothetical protein
MKIFYHREEKERKWRRKKLQITKKGVSFGQIFDAFGEGRIRPATEFYM